MLHCSSLVCTHSCLSHSECRVGARAGGVRGSAPQDPRHHFKPVQLDSFTSIPCPIPSFRVGARAGGVRGGPPRDARVRHARRHLPAAQPGHHGVFLRWRGLGARGAAVLVKSTVGGRCGAAWHAVRRRSSELHGILMRGCMACCADLAMPPAAAQQAADGNALCYAVLAAGHLCPSKCSSAVQLAQPATWLRCCVLPIRIKPTGSACSCPLPAPAHPCLAQEPAAQVEPGRRPQRCRCNVPTNTTLARGASFEAAMTQVEAAGKPCSAAVGSALWCSPYAGGWGRVAAGIVSAVRRADALHSSLGWLPTGRARARQASSAC